MDNKSPRPGNRNWKSLQDCSLEADSHFCIRQYKLFPIELHKSFVQFSTKHDTETLRGVTFTTRLSLSRRPPRNLAGLGLKWERTFPWSRKYPSIFGQPPRTQDIAPQSSWQNNRFFGFSGQPQLWRLNAQLQTDLGGSEFWQQVLLLPCLTSLYDLATHLIITLTLERHAFAIFLHRSIRAIQILWPKSQLCPYA